MNRLSEFQGNSDRELCFLEQVKVKKFIKDSEKAKLIEKRFNDTQERIYRECLIVERKHIDELLDSLTDEEIDRWYRVVERDQSGVEDKPIRRALSAYIFFSNAYRPEVQRLNPGLKFGDVAKIISQKWSIVTPEEKQPFNDLAIKKDLIKRLENP